jgi:hypothetical protein
VETCPSTTDRSRRDRRRPDDVESLGATGGPTQDEGTFQRGDHFDDQSAGIPLGNPTRHELAAAESDPVVEDLGTGLAQYLAAVRDLEGDGGDRTRVGVVRRDQVVGGAGKEVVDPNGTAARAINSKRQPTFRLLTTLLGCPVTPLARPPVPASSGAVPPSPR